MTDYPCTFTLDKWDPVSSWKAWMVTLPFSVNYPYKNSLSQLYHSEWFVGGDDVVEQRQKELLQIRINNDVKIYDKLPMRIHPG